MRKKRDELKDLRQFGIALAGILTVFGAIHFFRRRMILAQWFCGTGAVVMCLELSAPRMLKYVYSVFLKTAHAIGWFNTRVILIIIYFLLVTPIAVMMKIFGKDPLNRKIERNILTYWVKRPVPKALKEQLEKQF